jgi:ribosomal protein S18 acetylase RimI-like enzyme
MQKELTRPVHAHSVCLVRNEIAGVALVWYLPQVAELHVIDIATSEKFQRLGVATALLTTLQRRCDRTACLRIV